VSPDRGELKKNPPGNRAAEIDRKKGTKDAPRNKARVGEPHTKKKRVVAGGGEGGMKKGGDETRGKKSSKKKKTQKSGEEPTKKAPRPRVAEPTHQTQGKKASSSGEVPGGRRGGETKDRTTQRSRT